MLLNPNIQPSQLDSLFPSNSQNCPKGKAEEALQSHMIIGFEEAIGLGMPPVEALSQVLCWVASEMVRIKTAEGQVSSAQVSSSEAGGR